MILIPMTYIVKPDCSLVREARLGRDNPTVEGDGGVSGLIYTSEQT